jgi:hypothetical protein
MITCTIELELVDTAPLRAWFGDQSLEPGIRAIQVPTDVTLELKQVEAGSGFLESISVTVIVSFGASVAVNMLSSALYDVLKTSVRKIRVNDVPVRPSGLAMQEQLQSAVDASATDNQTPVAPPDPSSSERP